jgi:hypothetical protein
MRLEWRITQDVVELSLIPETQMDKLTMEGLGNVETAKVKRNGTLTFIMELPKTTVSKPQLIRPADDVRDNMG